VGVGVGGTGVLVGNATVSWVAVASGSNVFMRRGVLVGVGVT